MSVTATFSVPAREFPLGSSFADLDDVRVELEKVVPTNVAVVPYVWVRRVAPGAIREALAAHESTQRVSIVESIEDRHLLRIDWNPGHEGFLRAIVEADVVLLTATGDSRTWEFTVRGDNRESISRFQQYCRDASLPIDLTSVVDHSTGDTRTEYGLTDAQREALKLAYERGYFDSPRQATLADIAADLDISRQAFASRLRRGHRRLIENTLQASSSG